MEAFHEPDSSSSKLCFVLCRALNQHLTFLSTSKLPRWTCARTPTRSQAEVDLAQYTMMATVSHTSSVARTTSSFTSQARSLRSKRFGMLLLHYLPRFTRAHVRQNSLRFAEHVSKAMIDLRNLALPKK